jgi:hypothetical protein
MHALLLSSALFVAAAWAQAAIPACSVCFARLYDSVIGATPLSTSPIFVIVVVVVFLIY